MVNDIPVADGSRRRRGRDVDTPSTRVAAAAAAATWIFRGDEHQSVEPRVDIDSGPLRRRHLFVELHELKNNEWHETKRYNYGLEEDLEDVGAGGRRRWTRAHLPSISVFGMLAFRECLHEDLIILDVAAQDDARRALEPVALAIVDHLVRDGLVSADFRDVALRTFAARTGPPTNRGDAAAATRIESAETSARLPSGNSVDTSGTLLNHLNRRKCVEHDDELKALKNTEMMSQARTLEAQVSSLPRGPLETLGEEDEEPEQPKLKARRNRSFTRLFSMKSTKDEEPGPLLERKHSADRKNSGPPPPTTAGVAALARSESARLKRAYEQAEDTLKPDAEEEAVHVLIDDNFEWLDQDVVALVRLREPARYPTARQSGLELRQNFR